MLIIMHHIFTDAVQHRDLRGKTTMFPHPPLNSKVSLHRPSPSPSFPSPTPHLHHHFPQPPLSRAIIFLTRNQQTMYKFIFRQLCNHQLSLQL